MRRRLFAVLLASTIALAGWSSASFGAAPNGEASKPPDEIVADALKASIAASAVHVSGSGKSGGKPLALDLHLLAGKGGRGSVTASGLSFDIVRIGPTAYFRGDTKFWLNFGGATLAELLKGKWLMASAKTGDFASFTPLTDLDALLKQTLTSHGKLKTAGMKTIHGQPAIGILDTTQGGTLYIAATGAPYPLQVTEKGNGTIDFDGWNKQVALTAPEHALDYAKLKKK